MSYRIDVRRPAGKEVRRIGHNRVRRALKAIDAALESHQQPDQMAETAASIFVMRRRCKQLRALVRLVPSGVSGTRPVERGARKAARSGAPIRDATATLSALAQVEELVGDISLELAAPPLPTDLEDQLLHARSLLLAADAHIDRWVFDGDVGVLLGGLRRTYRDGRRLHRRLKKDTVLGVDAVEAAHEWRREAKYLRYQLRLLVDIAPEYIAPMLADLDRINDRLGADHDLWLVSRQLPKGEQVEAMDHHHASLQSEAIAAGSLVYAESARAFGDRFASYARVHAQR